MKTNYVLIDYENVQVKSLSLLKGEQFQVRVFLGPKNTKLPVEFVLAMQELNDHAEYIILQTPGPNALDFLIAYNLGVLAAADPSGFFHIISRDTGFDPLIKHLKTKHIFSARSASIDEIPCLNEVNNNANYIKDANGIGEVKPPSGHITSEGLIKIALGDLIKRKASKPRTVKTLLSTIHAKCGKKLPVADIKAVHEALVKRGYVKVNGLKVTYKLPLVQP